MHVLKNSLIYLGSSILNKMIPFFLLPIMTKYLSPEEYGRLSIYLIMITFYTAFIGMNIHINVSKNFFKFSKNKLSIMIGNILSILFVSFGFYLLLTILLSFFYKNIFSIPSAWLITIPFLSMMMMVNNINTTILRNEGKAYLFGIFEISNTAVTMTVTILTLLYLDYGWHAQPVGMLVSYSLFFVIALLYMKNRGYIRWQIDKTKIRSILGISLPLIPHVIGGAVIAMSDRVFIERMVGLDAVGIYSVGYMFGMVVMLFTDAFIKAWSPWFYKNLANPTLEKKKKIVKYTYLYILGIFVLALAIATAGKFILPYFVDKKFYEAGEYILWISLGYAIFGVYQIFFPYLVHIGKTSFLAISTVTAAITNLVLNYFFIASYGAIGAAYATIFAFLISAFLVFCYQKNKFFMPWIF